jgi:hypothetical protein
MVKTNNSRQFHWNARILLWIPSFFVCFCVPACLLSWSLLHISSHTLPSIPYNSFWVGFISVDFTLPIEVLSLFYWLQPIQTRDTRERWPLPTVETEVNGDSKSTYERGPSWSVCWAHSADTRDFFALAAQVGLVQNMFLLIVHYFSSFVPIAQQARKAVVLGHLSLSLCLWSKHSQEYTTEDTQLHNLASSDKNPEKKLCQSSWKKPDEHIFRE